MSWALRWPPGTIHDQHSPDNAGDLAHLLSAVAGGARLRILGVLLRDGACTGADLQRRLELSTSTREKALHRLHRTRLTQPTGGGLDRGIWHINEDAVLQFGSYLLRPPPADHFTAPAKPPDGTARPPLPWPTATRLADLTAHDAERLQDLLRAIATPIRVELIRVVAQRGPIRTTDLARQLRRRDALTPVRAVARTGAIGPDIANRWQLNWTTLSALGALFVLR